MHKIVLIFSFLNRIGTIFRNVTHLCNYWYLLYIERVLCTRKIFKLNLPRFWNYIHRGKNSCYSESLDSQLNLLWFDIIFSDIAKMTTNDSHIILHLLTLVFRVFRFFISIATKQLLFRVFRFPIESVMIDIIFITIVKKTINDSHIILHLWTLVLKLIWYSNIASLQTTRHGMSW